MAGGQTGFFQEAKTKLYSVVSCNSGIKLFICATKVSRYLCIFHNYCQFYFHSWYSYIFVSVLVFFVSGFGLGGEDCDERKCQSRCNKDGDHCDPLRNCSSGNYNCLMKCKGEGCKQKCDTGVELCELNLECIGNDCDQTCTANTCKLNCSGKFCKTQKCLKEGGLACEMDLECNHQDCEQICNADKCNLTCSGEKCKTQKCEGEGNVCEMDLECNGRDCDQTCKANRCKMNCSGRKCKTQKCQGRGYTCEMELECQKSGL